MERSACSGDSSPLHRFLLRYSIPLVVVGVALTQQLLVRAHDLSPWKGAGFGMFATIDQPASRVVRVYRVHLADSLHVDVSSLVSESSAVGGALRRARAMPSPGALAKVARELEGLRWSLRTSGSHEWLAPAEGDAAPGTSPAGERFHVEVWRPEFDPGTRRVSLVRLAAHPAP